MDGSLGEMLVEIGAEMAEEGVTDALLDGFEGLAQIPNMAGALALPKAPFIITPDELRGAQALIAVEHSTHHAPNT